MPTARWHQGADFAHEVLPMTRLVQLRPTSSDGRSLPATALLSLLLTSVALSERELGDRTGHAEGLLHYPSLPGVGLASGRVPR